MSELGFEFDFLTDRGSADRKLLVSTVLSAALVIKKK